MTKQKKCALVLPYFGKLHNYFQLFLNSCRKNTDCDWLVFTDDTTEYDYPDNVKRIPFTLKKFKLLAEEKIGISVFLDNPYKLCDFKPTYGLVFEDYLEGYPYWGHCDCDLLFGDLNRLLTPILNDEYDKIFAAGHLTIYQNTRENNRRFMSAVDDRYAYREALQSPKIYVFDEDYTQITNPSGINVHDIFTYEGSKIYDTDLAMNVSCQKSRFHRGYYVAEKRTFIREDYHPRRYYWCNGKICAYEWNSGKQTAEQHEYVYIHLQGRKMKLGKNVIDADIIEILPDRFVKRDILPSDKKSMCLWSITWTYGNQYDRLMKKIKNRLLRKK